MGILSKLVKIVKGGATSVGESIIDKNAITLLEQQIRDSEESVGKSKKSLANMMAQKEKFHKEVVALKEKLANYEKEIKELMAKGHEDLARQRAEEYGDLEESMKEKQVFVDETESRISTLKSQIKATQRKIDKQKREIDNVKATKQINDAAMELSESGILGASSSADAAETLKRIKEKEAMRAETIKAAETLEGDFSGADTDAKIKDALKSDVDPLARFKNS